MTALTDQIAAALREAMTERGLFFHNASIEDVSPMAEQITAALGLTEEIHDFARGPKRRWVSAWSVVQEQPHEN